VLFVALITALKNLQEKVRGLELERAAAAERYKTLKEDADRQLRESSPKRVEEKAVQSSPFVAREHSSHVPLNDSMHTSSKDRLKAQLNNRERELQYMRELLQRTEREKAQLQTQNRDMERQQEELKRRQLEEGSNRKEFAHPIVSPRMRPLRSEDDPQSEMGVWPNSHMTSIKRDFSALNHKVKELEGRLETEQDQRQKLVNSYNKMVSEADEMLLRSSDNHRPSVRPAHKRTKSCRAAVTTAKAKPGVHYRLNGRDIPFILGTSTSNSHSVVANMQKAVSLMKVHSHALCGAIASSALQREAEQRAKETKNFNPSGSMEELQSMLGDLEREFAELACEHQRIVSEHHYNQQSSLTAINDEELEAVAEKMRSKEEHIRIVKGQISALRKARKKKPAKGTRPLNLTTSMNKKEILKNMAYYEQADLQSVEKTPPHQRNLNLLRNAKDLQSTLQRDDLWWD
jgi:centrosomal protein CEP57